MMKKTQFSCQLGNQNIMTNFMITFCPCLSGHFPWHSLMLSATVQAHSDWPLVDVWMHPYFHSLPTYCEVPLLQACSHCLWLHHSFGLLS